MKAAAPKSAEPTPIPAEMRNPLANPVTDAQMEAIRSLCRRRSIDVDAVAKDKFGVEALSGLTQAQASDLIKTQEGPMAEASAGVALSHCVSAQGFFSQPQHSIKEAKRQKECLRPDGHEALKNSYSAQKGSG